MDPGYQELLDNKLSSNSRFRDDRDGIIDKNNTEI